MSQDRRDALHKLIDAYYDNVDGQYDSTHLSVNIVRDENSDDNFIADGVDVEIYEESRPEDWDGDIDGWGGIVKPSAIYINDQKVLASRDNFSVDLGPDEVAKVNVGLFLRSLVVKRIFKRDTTVRDGAQ